MIFNNPFELKGNWYKGNLHTHTNLSDGQKSVEEAIFWYKENGYHFLAITDHNKLYNGDTKSFDNFLIIKGIEFSIGKTDVETTFHLVALNIEEEFQVKEGISPQEFIDFIKSKGGEVILCHPYWSSLTIIDIFPLKNYLGIDVFNTTCGNIGKENSEVHWDDLLVRRKKIFAYAVDDSHRKEDYGGGWIMVKANKLDKESIFSSLRQGVFYSSTGPEIFDLTIKDKKIKITCSPVKKINFISDRWKGESVKAKNELITEGEFNFFGDEYYIRIQCIDKDGRKAWTNPIFF